MVNLLEWLIREVFAPKFCTEVGKSHCQTFKWSFYGVQHSPWFIGGSQNISHLLKGDGSCSHLTEDLLYETMWTLVGLMTVARVVDFLGRWAWRRLWRINDCKLIHLPSHWEGVEKMFKHRTLGRSITRRLSMRRQQALPGQSCDKLFGHDQAGNTRTHRHEPVLGVTPREPFLSNR